MKRHAVTGWRRTFGIIVVVLLAITAVVARFALPWSSLYFDIGAIVLIAVLLGIAHLFTGGEEAKNGDAKN